jgi:hypothetical protein
MELSTDIVEKSNLPEEATKRRYSFSNPRGFLSKLPSVRKIHEIHIDLFIALPFWSIFGRHQAEALESIDEGTYGSHT